MSSPKNKTLLVLLPRQFLLFAKPSYFHRLTVALFLLYNKYARLENGWRHETSSAGGLPAELVSFYFATCLTAACVVAAG